MSITNAGTSTLVESALNEPYCRFLGVRPLKVESGAVRVELPYREEISNPGRQVNGGVMSSMLGIAGRAAALSGCELPAPLSASSVEINVTYLSSAVGEDMIADGQVVRRGKELTHVRCALATSADKPLASAMVILRTVPASDEPAPSPLTAERADAPEGELPSIARALSGVPFMRALGIRADRFDSGRAELTLPARDNTCGAGGAFHEGALGTLIDAAGALSAWSNVRPQPGMKVSTVSIDVNFCWSPSGKDAIAYAHTVSRRKEIFYNRVDVLTPENVPMALGSVIYRIVLPD